MFDDRILLSVVAGAGGPRVKAPMPLWEPAFVKEVVCWFVCTWQDLWTNHAPQLVGGVVAGGIVTVGCTSVAVSVCCCSTEPRDPNIPEWIDALRKSKEPQPLLDTTWTVLPDRTIKDFEVLSTAAVHSHQATRCCIERLCINMDRRSSQLAACPVYHPGPIALIAQQEG
jgi:hypothetical protein